MGRELSDDIADDVGEIFTDTNDFGIEVTHRPRSGSTVTINGVFNESAARSLTDDRQGRQVVSMGSLLINSRDTSGNVYSIDDQGEFVIRSVRWAIGKVSPVPGGYLVTVKSTDNKTVRHLPGNS